MVAGKQHDWRAQRGWAICSLKARESHRDRFERAERARRLREPRLPLCRTSRVRRRRVRTGSLDPWERHDPGPRRAEIIDFGSMTWTLPESNLAAAAPELPERLPPVSETGVAGAKLLHGNSPVYGIIYMICRDEPGDIES
jgi:hypothetical protein